MKSGAGKARQRDGDGEPVPRTSASHPLTLSWVLDGTAPGLPGKLGLCYCPGKKIKRKSVVWERQLDPDLQRLRRAPARRRRVRRNRAAASTTAPATPPAAAAARRETFGVQRVVCLLSDAELRWLHVEGYEAAVARAGMQLRRLDIVEMAAPPSASDAQALVLEIAAAMREGGVVAVHCRGGVGRAGTIAACTLLELRLAKSAGGAIAEVRRRRCKQAVESKSQEDFVKLYAAKWLTPAGAAAAAAAPPRPAAGAAAAAVPRAKPAAVARSPAKPP